MRNESNETIPTDMELLNAYARSGAGSEGEALYNKRLLNAFEWLDQVKLKAVAAGLEEAADDYQERADHETPADIDPDWLRQRAERIRNGLPTSGSVGSIAPQDDFEE